MEEFLKKFSGVPNKFIEDFYSIAREEYNENDFAIDFYRVVLWLKVRRENLKRLLISHFEEEYDYIIEVEKVKHRTGASIRENIFLTSNCFKELCMLSRTEKAKEVRKYFIAMENLVKRYHDTIKEQMYKKIGILLKNQKPKTKIEGGVVYILEAQNSDVTLYKIGKTVGLKNRLNTYNSGNANEVEPLFILKVKDVLAVEACVKKAIRKYQYRKYKEIFEIDLDVLKEITMKCGEFSDGLTKFVEDKMGSKKLERLRKTKKQLFLGIFRDDK